MFTAALLALAMATPDLTPTARHQLPAVAHDIGCAAYRDRSATSPFTLEYGECRLAGSRVQLYRFANRPMMSAFWTSVAGFGVGPADAVTRSLIVVAPAKHSQLGRIRRAWAD